MNPVTTWDVTCPCDDFTPQQVKDHLTGFCREWAFQKEKAAGGLVHWQLRVHLRRKLRFPQALTEIVHGPLAKAHISPTTTHCMGDNFYVMKQDTRIEGPWTSKDEVVRDPGKIAKELRPWQQKIVDIINSEADDRTIHLIIDSKGGIGKSTLVRYLLHHNLADCISDLITSPKDISRHVAGSRAYVGISVKNAYVMDIPRDNRNTREIWHCLESVKNGIARDDRYVHRKIDPFPHPHIFVFTNTRPPAEIYTSGRIVEITPE